MTELIPGPGRSCPVGATCGFTLIEVMIALVVGSMAVTGSAALLIGLSNQHASVQELTSSADRDGNGIRVLTDLVSSIRQGPELPPGLVGGPSRVELRTHCISERGWTEPCEAELRFEPADESSAAAVLVVASDPPSRRWVLWIAESGGHFTFLAQSADGGTWTREWTGGRPPLALGVVTDGDTLLVAIRHDG